MIIKILDPKEKYNLTFLNVPVILGFVFIITFSIINWDTLSGHGGWGVLGVIMLIVITLFAFIIDGILQAKIKDKKKNNKISLTLGLIYIFIILSNFI